MLAITRRVHLAAAGLFGAGVLVLGYLAGTAIVELGGSGDFGLHVSLGYTLMGVLAICVPVFALLGRFPRGHVGLSLILLILYVVQTSLPYARASSPAIAALHPAVAMVLLGLAVTITIRARRGMAVDAAT